VNFYKLIKAAGILFLLSHPTIAQDPQNMKVESQVLDCGEMKTSFADIKEAKETLEKTVFAFTQELKTTKRNGIKEVYYYSCDNETGFLLIKEDDREIVYRDYPRFQWKLLIETTDLDDFYDKNVRGKYMLVVRDQ
jgi:hypothetical protein